MYDFLPVRLLSPDFFLLQHSVYKLRMCIQSSWKLIYPKTDNEYVVYDENDNKIKIILKITRT